MESLPSALPIDLNPTLGAYLIGSFISLCLFGTMSLQVLLYYVWFLQDLTFIKLLVVLIWALYFGFTICTTHAVYTIAVLNFGSLEILIDVPMGLRVSIFFLAFMDPISQAFFAARIFKISGKIHLPAFFWFLSFLRCIGGVVIAEKIITMSNIFTFEAEWRWLIKTVLSLGAIEDILISLVTCYSLRKQAPKNSRRTLPVARILSKWVIQTGGMIGLLAVTCIITFAALPNAFIWMPMYIVWSGVTCNSLLALLLARTKLRAIHLNAPSGNLGRIMIPTSPTSVPPSPIMTQMPHSPRVRSFSASSPNRAYFPPPPQRGPPPCTPLPPLPSQSISTLPTNRQAKVSKSPASSIRNHHRPAPLLIREERYSQLSVEWSPVFGERSGKDDTSTIVTGASSIITTGTGVGTITTIGSGISSRPLAL